MFLAPSKVLHRPGSPDVWGQWRQWPAYLEFKNEVGKATPEQLEFIAEAKSKGAIAEVVHSFDEAVRVLRKWDEQHGIKWKGEWTP